MTVTFKYDPFGRRIEKISPTTTSIFAYDGNNLIETVNATGSTVARYTQGLNIDEPLAMLRSSTTSYYEADGLGSISSLTSSAGAVASTYTYDSFGNVTNSTGTLRNPFSYTAREFDSETGLYYYRARYYDATTGRFLREDPERFGAGDNFYSYVANSPTNETDPLGLWQITIGGGEGIGGVITFGHNSGQWNFGTYVGLGVGLFGGFDPTDSGCHSPGHHGGVKTESGLGAGDYLSLSTGLSSDENGNIEPEIKFNATFPQTGGGLTWDPLHPHEPPHGGLGAGAGGFAGIGVTNYSEASCGCD